MNFSIDKRKLPPLDSLVAFEAAARLGSFKLAGSEIHLTPSAISRQVKALENHLGVLLFERVRQRIMITEAGRFLATQVRQTLGHLLTVSDQAAHLRNAWSTLNIGVLPAFANYWLIPKLSDFLQSHPDILINLIGVGVGVNYDSVGLDAAIVTNARVWSDGKAEKLGDECLIAVASPQWCMAHQAFTPSDLLQCTLLVLYQRAHAWSQWFESNGVEAIKTPKQLQFGHYSMVIEAAIASLGVALVPHMLCSHLIDSGKLTEIKGVPISIGAGYFFCHPLYRDTYQPMNSFKEWLLKTLVKEPLPQPINE